MVNYAFFNNNIMAVKINKFEEVVLAHLDIEKMQDALLNEAMLKTEKTIKECCIYITSEVRKSLASGEKCGVVEDKDVFSLAKEYYLKEKVDAPEKVSCSVSASVEKPAPVQKPKPKIESGMMSLFDL